MGAFRGVRRIAQGRAFGINRGLFEPSKNAEVARRAGLSERRYAHYVSGKRKPDFATLVHIAEVLVTTPNVLLDFGAAPKPSATSSSSLKDRLQAAAHVMTKEALHMTVVQAEAPAALAASALER